MEHLSYLKENGINEKYAENMLKTLDFYKENNWEYISSGVHHDVKKRVVKECQDKHNYTMFVETGTLHGDMVIAQLNNFSKIVSIELVPSLANTAKNKFKNNSNVEIIQGDSGVVLSNITNDLKESVIFWLDGHFSGSDSIYYEKNSHKGNRDCPIMDELRNIFKNKEYTQRPIVLIDDARLFIGQGDYPSVKELSLFLDENDYCLKVDSDIIICTPNIVPRN